MLTYYDKAYQYCIAKRDKTKVFQLALHSPEMNDNANNILKYVNEQLKK